MARIDDIHGTCDVCGKQVYIKSCVKRKKGCKDRHYCCKQHAEWGSPKAAVVDLLQDILGKVCVASANFDKDLRNLATTISYQKILNYLIQDKNYIIESIENKVFRSDYAKHRYCLAIIRNNINNGTFKYEPSFSELGLNEDQFIDTDTVEIGKGIESNHKDLKEGLDKRLEDILNEM